MMFFNGSQCLMSVIAGVLFQYSIIPLQLPLRFRPSPVNGWLASFCHSYARSICSIFTQISLTAVSKIG